MDFAKFSRTPFLWNASVQPLLDFSFISLFLVTQWTNKNQFFFIFVHVLSRVLILRNDYYEFKGHSCGCMETHISRWHHIEFSDVLLANNALRDLVPFVQFQKREKHPWRSVTFSKVAGLTLIHGSFWRFLNCTNGTNRAKNHNYILTEFLSPTVLQLFT